MGLLDKFTKKEEGRKINNTLVEMTEDELDFVSGGSMEQIQRMTTLLKEHGSWEDLSSNPTRCLTKNIIRMLPTVQSHLSSTSFPKNYEELISNFENFFNRK